MQTHSSPNVILAIAPGKRELGVAVFAGADLVYVSVKTIRHRRSRKLLLREIAGILRQLFEEFSITIVVIKVITQYQKLSPDLKRIVARIELEADQKGLQVVGITLEQIKSVLCRDDKATEKKAFETLLADYPQLEKYWNRPNKWQNDYYAFLFSAAAVGAVYLKTFSEDD